MLKGLRRLDVYPKTLEDFTEKTTTGAVVSLVTLLFVLWLFVSEVSLFMAHEVDPQLFVDTERSDKIRINLDLYFPAMPCSFLTLDAMDSAGELQLDLAHNVFKRRHRGGVPLEAVRENVAQRGDPPRPAPPAANASAPEAPAAAAVAVRPERPACGSCYGAQTRADQCCNTCEEVREAYRIRGWAFANPEGIAQCNDEGFVKGIEESKGEGCQVYGYLLVNKARLSLCSFVFPVFCLFFFSKLKQVAGNFHFSPGKSFQAGGAHVHDYGLFRQQFFNVSHNINTLSFGVQFPGVVNPLDRANKTHNTPSNRLYQYYIKVTFAVFSLFF